MMWCEAERSDEISLMTGDTLLFGEVFDLYEDFVLRGVLREKRERRRCSLYRRKKTMWHRLRLTKNLSCAEHDFGTK